ncbi:hypothetical protein D3C85_1816830 [compost metagenome]
MMRVNLHRINTAHRPVKSLCFFRGMRRDIQLLRTPRFSLLYRHHKQASSKPGMAEIRGDMQLH